MPWSNDCFDEYLERWFATLRPASMIDIGAGAGKYGKLLRRASPHTFTVAVEPDADYIEGFGLASLYDEVRCGRAEELFFAEPDLTVDLVIFGDSIEHMRKSVGVDLLHYFAYRSRCIVCVYPSKYVQYSLQGHAAEAHLSVWGPGDFAGLHTEHRERDGMNLAVVTGFLADAEATLASCGVAVGGSQTACPASS